MIKNIFILILLVVTIYSFSSENEKNTKSILYEDFMQAIMHKIPELRKTQVELDKSQNTLYKAQSLNDIELKSNIKGLGYKNYNDTSNNVLFNYSAGFSTDLELSRTLQSGTKLTFGGTYSQIYSNGQVKSQSTGLYESFNSVTYDPEINIGVFQPLLYNWFGFIDRYTEEDARMKLEIDKLKKYENDNSILNYYKKLYFNWLAYYLILEKLTISINNAAALEKQCKEKLESGLADDDEYEKAKYTVLKYKEQYNQYETEYQNISNEIFYYLNDNDNDNNDNSDVTLIPELESLDKILAESGNNKIVFIDFSKTRYGKILKLTKINLEYNKEIKSNQTLPKLNLFGNIDIKFHNYVNDSELLQDNFSPGDIDFIAGIEFIYPLGNRKAQADLKETELIINDFLIEYEITLRDYNNRMEIIISNLGKGSELIKLKNKSLASLFARQKSEKQKYNQARLDLRNLVDTHNSIITDEIELVKFKVLLVHLYLDYLDITLP